MPRTTPIRSTKLFWLSSQILMEITSFSAARAQLFSRAKKLR